MFRDQVITVQKNLTIIIYLVPICWYKGRDFSDTKKIPLRVKTHKLYSLSIIPQNNQSAFIIKTILIECGLSGIWDQQRVENPKWLKESVKQKLKDLFVQKWLKWLGEMSSGRSYSLYKDIFQYEQYLTKLDFTQAKQLLAFRTRNNRLPVETSRWGKIK